MRNLDLGKISTSHLVQTARRTKALRVLYKNADITAKEFSLGKNSLRSVLESEMFYGGTHDRSTDHLPEGSY